MSGKQKEGDNPRRRALARRAREQGRRPSEAGVTLGAAKQFEHREHHDREGPPPAGARKPGPRQSGRPWSPRPPEPSWPAWDPAEVGVPSWEPAEVAYRDLVAEVAHRARLDFDAARPAAAATIAVLARSLGDADRERLLDALPAQLHGGDADGRSRPGDLPGFLAEIAAITGRPPDQARYQAQATLSALADRAAELVASFELPPDLRELFVPPPQGGGVVGPTGQVAPLTDDELRAALDELPYWSGDANHLSRTLVLPPGDLDRVLRRLERLGGETGRKPHIGRQADGAAVVVVRTNSVDAVTGLDVALAHRVDAAIDEAAGGMAAPGPSA